MHAKNLFFPINTYIIMEYSRQLSYNREKSNYYQYALPKGQSIINKMANSKSNASTEFKTSVIGVDLGSSLTKIAAVEKGVVDIITNEANLRQTPTIVGYGANERLIGEAANVKIKSNLNNSILAPHRYLGIRCPSYLQQEGKHSPCQLKQQEAEMLFKVNCQGQEAKVAPEQAAAAFFTKVQQIVQLNNITNKFLTVSVPNFLTHQEKQALLDSLQIARRSCKHQYGVSLVNESAAVGLDYAFYKKMELSDKQEEGRNVMFVDFGHSKLSLYVIRFTKNYQKVLYHNHLRQTGCKNLDECMLAFYSQLFEKNNPNLEITVKESKKATIKLLENIERQRKILSGNSEYDFNIDCLLEECDISYTMRREEFESIIAPVIAQIRQFFIQTAQDIRTLPVTLSSVELIGGGSRIPLFIRTLAEAFGIEPQRTLNSSECIARGAALFSAMNSGIFRMQAYHSVELSPETLVCSWTGEGEEIQDQSNEIPLYSQNEVLFSKKNIELSLNNSPLSLLFSVNTNSQLVQHSTPICSFKVTLPEGSAERKIKLMFEVNTNNMISKVSAYEVKQTEVPLSVTEFRLYEDLPEAKINEFSKVEREQMLKDIKILQHYENKNKFESKIYELKEKLASSLRNADFRDFINPKTYNDFLDYFAQLENDFEAIDNFEEKVKEVTLKLTQFHQQAQQTKKKYIEVEKELQKFAEYIDNVVSGKIKRVKYYPKEEVENAQEWIKQVQQEQKGRNKYEPHITNTQQVASKLQALKESIQKLEEEIARKERQERQNDEQFYYQQPRHEQRYYQNDPFGFNPFNSAYHPRQYEQRNRGRGRNSSFNGYNSGMFSGFPGFF